MRRKELRLALVCYGGVSLAVYMHGVTKEVWHLARASRDFAKDAPPAAGVETAYHALLHRIAEERGIQLRILPDILTGASAGGINAVFLADAVHGGHSLEPLTEMWLTNADIDQLTHPDARPVWRFAKLWAQPLVWWLMRQPGSAVSESVAPETRSEVTTKLSRLVRGRWFQPPFSGDAFSLMLASAIRSLRRSPVEAPLLPPGHPLDLVVTATDFHGHRELLRLHSPPVVTETEHRLPIRFSSRVGRDGGAPVAELAELVFAARATASFPGAFPPLGLAEIDRLLEREGIDWPSRSTFIDRLFPRTERTGIENVALIDGSVLVNAPFAEAITALPGKPAQHEFDRRIVYIDPRPDGVGLRTPVERPPVGFFNAIFGSLSTIPREQPIRDNVEALEEQSREALRLRQIVTALRPEVERTVEALFGRTLFLDRPTPRRLRSWRAKAQQSAANAAGYAFHSYAQAKFTQIVERLARLIFEAAEFEQADEYSIAEVLRMELASRGLDTLVKPGGAVSEMAVTFMRQHDLAFRIRRTELLARRLARDWEHDPEVTDEASEAAREAIYRILSLYYPRERAGELGSDFPLLAARVLEQPGAAIDALAERRLLPETDEEAEEILSAALVQTPPKLRRRMLLTYLGFPYYDVATFPLTKQEGFTEFDPIKVDRISPEDARSIRPGGTTATLRGIEFYNFGAFFSRAYRENDYLWGRLHGAERMIDLVASTLDDGLPGNDVRAAKQAAFLAILNEEELAGRCAPTLLAQVRAEVEAVSASAPDSPS
jgi:patatin-related protein